MSAAKTRPPMSTNSIDLVDKNNTRGVLFPLDKQIPHTGRSHTDKHFNKIRAADTKKRHLSLSCNRAGSTRVLDNNSASAISPKASRAANDGIGKHAGLDNTRPKVPVNSLLVTGFGETTLTGPLI